MNVLIIYKDQVDIPVIEEIFRPYDFSLETVELSRFSIHMDYDKFHLIIILGDDFTEINLHILDQLFHTKEPLFKKEFKCILVLENENLNDQELEKYRPYILSKKMIYIEKKEMHTCITHYIENQIYKKNQLLLKTNLKKSDFIVLVADDSSIYRKAMVDQLEAEGYEVLQASDGLEAYDLYRQRNVKLVISDIEMPNLTGIQLCEKIRENDDFVEVILVSAYGEKETIDYSYHIGINDFFSKPVDTHRLLRKVNSIYNNYLYKSMFQTLIIDDDRFLRSFLNHNFAKNHMPIINAVNGLDGISKAVIYHPEVVITDVHMPIINGYELISLISEVEFLENTVKIMISGTFEPGKMKAITNDMSIQFYAKPFDIVELVKRTEQNVFYKLGHLKRENKMLLSSITTLNRALEDRDRYTRGHSERVQKYSRWIGEELGLSEPQMEILSIAAELHDIGKIGVPDAILLKPDKLTEVEYCKIQSHCEKGYHIISSVKSLDYVASIVLSHHERFDGKGYPNGLSGSSIPIEAQIIAVADTYDALTSNRPYRKTISHEEAIDMMLDLVNTQLNGNCLDALLRALNRKTRVKYVKKIQV